MVQTLAQVLHKIGLSGVEVFIFFDNLKERLIPQPSQDLMSLNLPKISCTTKQLTNEDEKIFAYRLKTLSGKRTIKIENCRTIMVNLIPYSYKDNDTVVPLINHLKVTYISAKLGLFP